MNIQRIRRVLRARNGSQIPKFQTPFSPLQLNIKDYSKLKFFNLNSDFNWQMLQQGNPYMVSTGIPSIVQTQAPSFSPEAQQVAEQGMQQLQTQYNNNLKQKQEIVSSSINPEETASKLAQGKSLNNLNTVGTLGNIAGFASTFINKDNSALTTGANTAYDIIADKANLIPGWGNILSAGMKIGGLATDMLQSNGFKTDQITTKDKIFGSKFFALTPTGIVNVLGSSKTQDFSVDNNLIERRGSSYTGTVKSLNDAASKAGKTYGLFSTRERRNADKQISQAKINQNKIGRIDKQASDMESIATNMSDLNHLAYAFNMNGGYDQRYLRAAKQGMKIARIKKLKLYKTGGTVKQTINVNTREIENTSVKWTPIISEVVETFDNKENIEWKPVITESIEEFKNGGKTEDLGAPKIEETTQKNVIPEGALHAHKHHMENAEGLTKKGIPVIDNDGEQQAEIEREEIIFSLEVTKKLEELYSKYKDSESSNKEKEEVAIEAGKLLVKEILFNTIDNAGLIDTLKQGGIIDGYK